ncbi:type IV pilin protein [Photobacterium atrarenae]|uniref:Type IV pilin protein n=2 Tax=Photobacterium atrarenae TaxID=865757 RepID=A0ABY5GJP9_9GAMM|nr:type IV pilin protein [Photobacterium atrarenae]
MELQLWAEQYFTQHRSYPSSSNLSTGSPSCSACTLSKHYTFSIANSGTGQDRFVIAATVKPSGAQKNDSCQKLTINAAGVKKGYGTGDSVNLDCWP